MNTQYLMKEQIVTAEEKNVLFTKIIFNFRVLQETIPLAMNVPQEITPEFKKFSKDTLETLNELAKHFENIKKFIPVYPETAEVAVFEK